MINKKFDIQEIERKNVIVDNAIAQLKKEFIGIDKQIDEIMNNVRTWFLFPQLQTRPLTICLFGMSGCGKTDLVKRISQLLDIEKDYVYFNFAAINESSSWEIEEKIEEEISNEKSNRIFVYDEFQYAATINPINGEEYDRKTGLKTFWELLDSGLLHKRGSYWNSRVPLKILDYMTKINLKHRMKIEEGIWVNAEECLAGFSPYDIKAFSEVFNFPNSTKKTASPIDSGERIDKKEYADSPMENTQNKMALSPYDNDKIFFINPFYLEKLFDLYETKTGGLVDRLGLYHSLEAMDCEAIMDFVADIYEGTKKGYNLKFNDSIIFVIANLDEAYEISFNVNPDMSPDQFRKVTEKISIVAVKEALQKRFRNEQITRLGNIHVIYPSFSEQNFKDIIDLYLNKNESDTYKLSGYHLKFDDSIKQIIYDEGVYPTQGTRPIFSTIYEIVKSRFPEIIRHICECGYKDEVSYLRYTFNYETNNVVVYCCDENDTELTSKSFEIKLRLKKLRDTVNDEEQALCALHESGHFVMYSKLFGKIPEKIVSRTTSSDAGGFLMEDADEASKKLSKRDMLNEIKVLLGGYVAEKEIFGEEMTRGASKDLYQATQLASKMIRRYCMGNEVYVTTNCATPDDAWGFLVNEDNQNYINRTIKDILQNAENEVRQTFQEDEWRKMLKESSLYLCEHSSMSKEKMQELYDKVADEVKETSRSDTFYRDRIANM